MSSYFKKIKNNLKKLSPFLSKKPVKILIAISLICLAIFSIYEFGRKVPKLWGYSDSALAVINEPIFKDTEKLFPDAIIIEKKSPDKQSFLNRKNREDGEIKIKSRSDMNKLLVDILNHFKDRSTFNISKDTNPIYGKVKYSITSKSNEHPYITIRLFENYDYIIISIY